MEYPLQLTFKIMSFGHHLHISDATGTPVLYVKQKYFKLKEDVNVYTDERQADPIFKINADRVIDFSARYNFTDINGMGLGWVKRHGGRSLWKAHYEIADTLKPVMTIREVNPWVKVLDAILREIPIIGLIAGYILHPAYRVTRDDDGTVVMTLKKQPSFFERSFIIEKETELSEEEQTRVLLGLLMMILLERTRG
ncbi:MAG: hypothetical protein SVY53_14950 [Chloroflexota bacterium]|nr:hypothetical protein [Chloroflexota bacterium]